MDASNEDSWIRLKNGSALFRSHYGKYDRRLIDGESLKYSSLGELEENLQNGRFRVIVDKTDWFECFYHGVSNPEWIYVVYTGAVTNEKLLRERQPAFVRWAYYPMVELLGGAILCIADPMLERYDGLHIGWYYGDDNKSLIASSLSIVKRVCARFRIRPERVCFFSSSGGGYAGIYAASIMQGAIAVAINPIIYIYRSVFKSHFEDITGFDTQKPDPLHRNDLARMIQNSKSHFCILFNLESEYDIRCHALPLCKELGINPQYGHLSQQGNVLLWLYEAKGNPKAHNAQETRELFFAIDAIAKKFHTGFLEKDFLQLALSVTECWRIIYEQSVACKHLQEDVEMPGVFLLPNCPIHMGHRHIKFQEFGLQRKAGDTGYHNFK